MVIYSEIAGNEHEFVAQYGREFLRELLAIVCMEDDRASLAYKHQTELKSMFLRYKLVTRATKTIRCWRNRVYRSNTSVDYVYTFQNGRSKVLLRFEISDALKQLVFSDEEVKQNDDTLNEQPAQV